jgi:hypothetical protein
MALEIHGLFFGGYPPVVHSKWTYSISFNIVKSYIAIIHVIGSLPTSPNIANGSSRLNIKSGLSLASHVSFQKGGQADGCCAEPR